MAEKHRIAKAAGLMSGATMISRVLGYIRDMVIAFYLGATGLADTFFTAFRIPNLLRELFAEGSTASAVIPVLTEYEGTDRGEANRLIRVTLGFVTIIVGAVCVLGMIFAPAVVTLIAPGFLDEPEKFSLTVLLTRIMFPFLFFISLASVAMGALNTRRVFFVPAVAPAFLNISIITCVFIAALQFEHPVLGAAAGVSLGGLAQFLIQTPLMKRYGYSLKPLFDLRHPGLRKILKLVLPMTFAISVSQIYIFIQIIIASFLPEGSITYLFYSMRLIQFPIGVFGVAMGMAVLPSLSEHARKGDLESVRDDFSFSLRLLFFIAVPSMVGLITLREPIVNLLFQRGEWDALATAKTAQALFYYSLGIWAVVGARVMTSTFYSMQDTKVPVRIAVLGLIVNIIMSLVLMRPMLHSGLALAHAIAFTLNFSLLFYFLRKKLGGLRSREILSSFARTFAASAIMAAPCAILLRGDIWQHGGEALLKSAMLGGTIVLAVIAYGFASMALGSTEVRFVLQLLMKKFSTTKGNTHGG